MITEAGLIGKIGFNSFGVGVCLNAIRTPGVDFGKLPLHLALRAVLNSTSAAAAVATLEKVGVACAGHILIADTEGGVGMEWSVMGCKMVEPKEGVVCHTNHFLREMPVGVKLGVMLEDSPVRMARIVELLRREKDLSVEKAGGKEVSVEDVERMLDDEQGFPYSINRAAVEREGLQTLFSIVMDLRGREGGVRVGRPTEGGERVVLRV
jgi:isopenicillin-N N-acyltransferase-like protein